MYRLVRCGSGRERIFRGLFYDFAALSGRSFPVSYSVRTVGFPFLRAWPRFRYDFYGGVRVVKPFAYGREYRRENSGRHAGRADLSAHFGQDADGPADAARFGQCFRARGAGRRVDIQSGNVGLVSGARARRVDRFQHADPLPAALQAPETPDQGRYGDDRSGREDRPEGVPTQRARNGAVPDDVARERYFLDARGRRCPFRNERTADGLAPRRPLAVLSAGE